jgi:hypothetical protein
MVLPASGVALCWTLLMTLWLPLLDHARSFRPLVERLVPHLAGSTCVIAEGTPRALQASLEHFAKIEVVAGPMSPRRPACDVRLTWVAPPQQQPSPPEGWAHAATVGHPSDRDNRVAVWRREPAR